RIDAATVHGGGCLHPRRWTPRQGDDLGRRINRQRALQERDDVGVVVRDGEMSELRIRLAGGHVVVGVVPAGRKVRSTHGLAQKAEAYPIGATEELLHQRALLCWS